MPDGNAIRTQRTRARILAESLALFNAMGEGRVSTALIADAAGISAGNLHYHFRTREALVAAHFDAFERAMDIQPRTASSAAEAVEDLWLFLHLMLEALERYRFLTRSPDELARRDPRLAERHRRVMLSQRAAIVAACGSLARHGAMRAGDADIDALAANVLIVATYWPSFRQALAPRLASRTDASGEGAHQVMMLVAPYLAGDARRAIERLGRSYID
jgi:AcrR family transcriptional regulator